jgi:hypothetical protein
MQIRKDISAPKSNKTIMRAIQKDNIMMHHQKNSSSLANKQNIRLEIKKGLY